MQISEVDGVSGKERSYSAVTVRVQGCIPGDGRSGNVRLS